MVIERKTCEQAEVKFVDEGTGIMVGYGAKYGNIDRGNEIMMPNAPDKYIAEYVRDGFIGVNHDYKANPVAMITDAKSDSNGFLVTARFHSTTLAQETRTTAMERMANGKSVLLSLGYLVKRDEWAGKTRKLHEVFPLETSFANVPMNPLAAAVSVKSFHSASAALPLAPLDEPWDASQAEQRLIIRMGQKNGRYTDGGGTGDMAPEGSTSDIVQSTELGYAWSYLPGAAYDAFGVFKLPIADVAGDGSLRVVPAAIKEAADLVHNSWSSLGIPDSELPKVKTVLDSYFARMRDEFGATAPLPPWEGQTKTSPLAGLTLEDHSEQVLAALTGYTERVTGINTIRTKSGRKLGADSRTRLRTVTEQIASMKETLDALLAESEPTPETVNVMTEFVRYQKTIAEHFTPRV